MRVIAAVYAFIAHILGRNLKSTPIDVIVTQMNEPRPLPMGLGEFEEWSRRIIAGATIPSMAKGDPDYDQHKFIDSQKFALANMLLHLGPTESHKPDAFFIHSLRKYAINQVADAVRVELRDKRKSEENV